MTCIIAQIAHLFDIIKMMVGRWTGTRCWKDTHITLKTQSKTVSQSDTTKQADTITER